MSMPMRNNDDTPSYPEYFGIDGPRYPATECWDAGSAPSEDISSSDEENTGSIVSVGANNFKGIRFFVKNKETHKLYGVLNTIDVYAECRFVLVDMASGDITVSSAINFNYPFSNAYNCTPKTRIST